MGGTYILEKAGHFGIYGKWCFGCMYINYYIGQEVRVTSKKQIWKILLLS